MRVAIVDDEPLARQRIRHQLVKHADIDLIAEAADGHSAIEMISAHLPQLVFLDVQMPDMSGFDVLRNLQPGEVPFVVFVTAYDRYAVSAFEVHALDYLLKPLDEERFERTLDHARRQIAGCNQPDLAGRIARLLDQMEASSADEHTSTAYVSRLSVRSGQRIAIVPVDDIDWIEAAGDYAMLHVGKRSHLLRVTMNRIEKQLDPHRFIRIHRSAIVQACRIAELVTLDNREYMVRLRDGTELKASRTYSERIERWL